MVLEPGSYGTPANPLATALTAGGGITDIGGTPGGAPVAIYSTNNGTAFTVAGGTLHDVTVVTSGSTALATTAPGIATRVTALSTAAGGVGCDVGSSVTDSVCLASGADGVAAQTVLVAHQNLGTVSTAVRNVTAEATGSGGTGFRASAGATGGGVLTLNFDATNDIVHGATTDLDAESSGGATATIFVRHSDFDPARTVGGDAIDSDATNISAAPLFLNAANGNFRERPASPTVDKGASRPAGDLDRAGNPRTVGAGPDIGGYELLVKPTISAVVVTKRTRHSVLGYVKGNAHGLATHVEILLTRHGQVKIALKEPQAFTHGFRVRFAMRSLPKHTTFRLHAVAKSIGGTTRSPSKRVTTRR